MDFLPIFMTLKSRSCLVVGGGEVALRKANLLQQAGAKVTVVAPEIAPEFATLSDVTCLQERYQSEQLSNMALVIAATNVSEVNQQVSRDAQQLNIPVNVVDAPELCTFIMPAILARGALTIAFSTGGNAPVLARLLRGKLETMIPQHYGQLVALASEFRQPVKDSLPDITSRRIFWEEVFEGDIAERVFANDYVHAKRLLQEKLSQQTPVTTGEVYLIGAGPGDPELLTFKALRLMQKADVVLYDNLVASEIVDMTRRDATRIYVGKQRNNHALPQEGINALLVKLALEGKRVVRLKGGDPFIFGRGGEEIESLVEHNIPFQVVPGITAASGVASYAGIPLTHRDYAQSCVFVTGHLKDGSMNLDWPALARENQTVVFYMGSHGLETLCAELIAHGKSPDTPMAMVQQGTTKNQRVLTATLATMPEAFKQTPLKPPTLIIIGGVVSLREKLNWFQPELN